ncbi:hypothetical protein L596_025214 [Steinernema carpocapsae]|uniref:Uncharacterized protein n=1 Tax=Steinernema carpocapsae TaxID=34508 RepID=A0A4U5M773_STECR|nr:hypothetical protein L596_025214 [Steinernema carpocapsae]
MCIILLTITIDLDHNADGSSIVDHNERKRKLDSDCDDGIIEILGSLKIACLVSDDFNASASAKDSPNFESSLHAQRALPRV